MAPGHAANKPTPWVKINPDSAVDRLPQPYRMIAKVVDDVLAEVGDRIDEIGRIQKLEEYEHVLPQLQATSRLIVAGRVTCACAEARGPARFAVGTNHGEVLVIDGRTRNGLCQKRPFGDSEAVHCIALASNGNYGSEPGSQAPEDQAPAPRPCPKLLVSGSSSTQVLVFSMVREQYGLLLEPACRITVPRPEAPDVPAAAPDADGEQQPAEPPPTPVQGLHATGTRGALWVVALMWDGAVRVYLCPLGAPIASSSGKRGKGDSSVYESIAEDDEEEHEGGDREQGSEEFDEVTQVETPQYCFALPTLAPLRGMSEPTVGEVMLSLFATRLPGHQRDGGQAPVFCFLSSPQSSVIVSYSIWRQGRAGVPDTQAMLSNPALPLGDIDEPTSSLDLQPRRRWTLPARITATAVSPNGAVFIAGTESGAMAVVLTAAGPWLKSMLPGHYAPVRALAFHNVDVVVSVGQDAWTHHYCVSTGDLLFRCLLSPPPTPAPGTTVAATAPGGAPVVVTLDEKGNLRLFDILRGKKVAKVSCTTREDNDAFGMGDGQGHCERVPGGLMATSACFFTFCDGTAEDEEGLGEHEDGLGEQEEEEQASTRRASDAQQQADAKDDHTWIVFFDVAEMLTQLYPGIRARVDRGDATVQDLFVSLGPEELAEAPPQNVGGIGDSAQLFGTTSNASTPKRTGRRTFTRQSSTVTSSAGGATPKRSGAERKSLVQRSDTSSSLASNPTPGGRRRTHRGQSPPGGKSSDSPPRGGGETGVARLTAQNLERLGTGARGRARALALRGGGDAAAGGCAALAEPEHWKVEVRRCLRRGLVDRDKRLDAIQRRVENLRKEVEGS